MQLNPDVFLLAANEIVEDTDEPTQGCCFAILQAVRKLYGTTGNLQAYEKLFKTAFSNDAPPKSYFFDTHGSVYALDKQHRITALLFLAALAEAEVNPVF